MAASEPAGAKATAKPHQPLFVCTLTQTLLLEWAQAVCFPGGYPAEERKLVLRALATLTHQQGFRAAAGPVIDAWVRPQAAAGLASAPSKPVQH